MNFMKAGSTNMDLSNPTFITAILLFLVGMVAAGTMVIPGISGSFVLMLLGAYEPIVKIIGDITNFSNLV